ncbi:MAG: carboxypeptidase-like regulatory domain-containing protein [Planctomycetota bacterium]|nr:carboxypeptidase-like regulatory domain-containing protein [Planctomycetota bacterium]
MKLVRAFKTFTVMLACTALLAGQTAQAASPIIRDIALQPGGILNGQVLNEQAVAQGQAKVAVVHKGKPLTVTETDKDGRFVVTGLEPGVYELHLAQGGGAYRVWAPRTAPPAAEQGVLLVQDNRVVRGLGGDIGKGGAGPSKGGGHFGWLANPWVLGALVAAAIAIPLALDDDAS